MDKEVEIEKKNKRAGAMVAAWGMVVIIGGITVALLGPLIIMYWKWALG